MRFVKTGEADAYIKQLRKRIIESMATQGLSRRSLCKLSGVSLTTVQRILSGTSGGNLGSVYAICAALGLQFDRINDGINGEIKERDE